VVFIEVTFWMPASMSIIPNAAGLFLVWMIRLWPSLIEHGPAGSARDRPTLASGGIQSLLALEIEEEGRAAED
jgi:hypothetical protein